MSTLLRLLNSNREMENNYLGNAVIVGEKSVKRARSHTRWGTHRKAKDAETALDAIQE
jgi:hypothetical protein